MNISDPTQVDYCIADWREMDAKWQLVSDLVAGTQKMRDVGVKWLPQETHEKQEAYNTRLKRSFLYGAYRDTIDKLASKPFSKLVSIEGVTISPWVEKLSRDVDKCGCTLTQFAYDIFWNGLNYGLSHALVDFPNIGRPSTQEDVIAGAVRPFWRLVDPRALIGWRWIADPYTGQAIVTEARIYETKMEPDGAYGEKSVEYVTHWTETAVTKWRRDDVNTGWVVQYSIPHTFGKVPLFTFYTNKLDVLKATPPLEDLAWLNIAHWISDSDHRNILRFARSGILLLTGISEEEYENGIVTGPTAVVRSTSEKADMRYVEYKGGAIPYGQQDLHDLERRMEVLGLQPVLEQSKYATAAGRTFDEIRAHSKLQQWINSLSEMLRDMLVESFKHMEPETDTSMLRVNVYYDPAATGAVADIVRNLVALRQAGEITREVLAMMLKRYGLISDDVDVDAMVEQLDAEEEEAKKEQEALMLAKGGRPVKNDETQE